MSGKSVVLLRTSRPRRGALAIVTNVGRDAVDALVRETSDLKADGEVVWS